MAMSASMCLCIVLVVSLLYVVRHRMSTRNQQVILLKESCKDRYVACKDREDAAMLPAWNASQGHRRTPALHDV